MPNMDIEYTHTLLALVGSLDFEIQTFENEVGNPQEHIIEGLRFITGTIGHQPIVLARTGGGKVNAGITMTLMVEHFRPNAVIFAGVAGGVTPELRLGDVVIAEKTIFHDFGEIGSRGFVPWKSWHAGTGERNPLFFKADSYLLDLAEQAMNHLFLKRKNNGNELRKFNIVKGVIVTGDVFCSSLRKKLELKSEFDADAVEMDGAAVAQVCWQHRIPCLVIRGISDVTEQEVHSEYERYCQVAMKNAATVALHIIRRFDSKCVSPNFAQNRSLFSKIKVLEGNKKVL